MKTDLYFLLLILFLTPGCSHKQQRDQPTEIEVRETQEALIGVNRMLIKKDSAKIADYGLMQKLDLKETESGLWYDIIEYGTGDTIKPQNRITLSYNISLLDGTECYHSDSLGYKQFIVGQGGVESGLEEGVLMLSKGSKAIFVLPPHLAHGLTGDGNRIPARSIIVYKVEVINVEI